MQIGKLKIALVFLFCLALAFQVWYLRNRVPSDQRQATHPALKHKSNFALLPATEIATYADPFAPPKPRMENWEPTLGDINDLEANLSQITALSSRDPNADQHIDDPNQYFRQYLAVVVNGKKIIFVNAMCSVEQRDDWRKRLIVVAGGGNCFWNAIYDPTTRTFSNLAVNGRA